MFKLLVLLMCVFVAVEAVPGKNFTIPQVYSADIKLTVLTYGNTLYFEGMLYYDFPNNNVASQGYEFTSEIPGCGDALSVSLCGNSTSYRVVNGVCEVDCCYGESETVVPKSRFLEHYLNLGRPRDGRDSRCGCELDNYLEYFVNATATGTNCTNADNTGEGEIYTLQIDEDTSLIYCVNPTNGTPYYTIISGTEDLETGIVNLIYVTYVTFTEGITNPSIFTVPASCNCTP